MAGSAKEITILLPEAYQSESARTRLFGLIAARFHEIGSRLMKHERPGHTLETTVLVDDAFQRLLQDENPDWVNREQFFCAAAKVMRRMLADYARTRAAQKRGCGKSPIALDNLPGLEARRGGDPRQLVELNDIVERLENMHPESFKVFNLHFFMGYELREIAEDILDMPYTTVKRRWGMAKAFLRRELARE